jgi:hypothetical protein
MKMRIRIIRIRDSDDMENRRTLKYVPSQPSYLYVSPFPATKKRFPCRHNQHSRLVIARSSSAKHPPKKFKNRELRHSDAKRLISALHGVEPDISSRRCCSCSDS